MHAKPAACPSDNRDVPLQRNSLSHLAGAPRPNSWRYATRADDAGARKMIGLRLLLITLSGPSACPNHASVDDLDDLAARRLDQHDVIVSVDVVILGDGSAPS